MPSRRKNTISSLSAGRPNVSKNGTLSRPSSKQGRTLIRRYHTLSKDHASALAAGDKAKAASLEAELDAQGGIIAYQHASRAGQSARRGGDTSRVLVDWIKELDEPSRKLCLLEVGALEVDNACAKSGLFEMTRIDLHSDVPGIKTEDFMLRSAPRSDAERFDCISLSLVVNYVPSPSGRGEMLKRLAVFLKSRASSSLFGPSVFLVLPAPCVTNSRYMTEDRLGAIMTSLGFTLAKRKLTAKLIHHLWTLNGGRDSKAFPKVEINPGTQRNNFAIVLEKDAKLPDGS